MILKQVSEIFQIGLGVLLASLGLKAFLLPNGFLDGGATGIAILLSELYQWDISIVLILVSLPFLGISWFTLSKRITLKSILAIISLAIMVHFENFEPITQDKLLISIFESITWGGNWSDDKKRCSSRWLGGTWNFRQQTIRS